MIEFYRDELWVISHRTIGELLGWDSLGGRLMKLDPASGAVLGSWGVGNLVWNSGWTSLPGRMQFFCCRRRGFSSRSVVCLIRLLHVQRMVLPTTCSFE
jgi:hypothetical protein